MAGSADGWQTVMPTSHAGIERLPRPQLESYERQTIKDWENSRGHWSGIGKHTSDVDFAEAKKIHARFKPGVDKVLGSGTYGVVEKVNYSHQNRSVCIARKWIQYRRGRTIKLLREEANVMEKLDHEHIVKLVGSYAVRHNELYLLLWPVAVCNLDSFFNDIDSLRTKQGDRDDILKRLEALNLKDVSALERRREVQSQVANRETCPLKYLQQIMGCITQAVSYCHSAHIRHLDLKPSNILLNPGRVYLADFGIARDVHDRDHTMTFGLQGTPKWRAPEVCNRDDEWSMNKADIYSLGLILVNIATILYGADMADLDHVLDDLIPHTRAAKLSQFHEKLRSHALATQEVRDSEARTFGPKHIIELTSRMLSPKPAERPKAEQVNADLVELGGIDQIYHSPCCKKSSRFVTDLMDVRYKVALDERAKFAEEHQRMAKELQVLKAKDETYELRIKNEQKKLADSIANLQDQLEKERKERKRLEALLAEMQHSGRRRHPPAMGPPPGIPRPERNISGGSGNNGSGVLTMRARQYSHPLPSANGQPKFANPTVTFHAQHHVRSVSPTAVRRPDPVPRKSSNPASTPAVNTSLLNGHGHPSPNPSPSPSPGGAGFPLRSRGSGSRLPRAVNPSTPIRSNTPALTRDPSLTDSTQFSMASSTFSHASGHSAGSESALGTGVGTPAMGSPALNKSTAGPAESPADASAAALTNGIGLGLGLGLEAAEDPTEHNKTSVRDTVSVASPVAAPGTASPVLTGSCLSSPRVPKADVDAAHLGVVRVPALPTAKSWADVARREKVR